MKRSPEQSVSHDSIRYIIFGEGTCTDITSGIEPILRASPRTRFSSAENLQIVVSPNEQYADTKVFTVGYRSSIISHQLQYFLRRQLVLWPWFCADTSVECRGITISLTSGMQVIDEVDIEICKLIGEVVFDGVRYWSKYQTELGTMED